MKKETFVYGTKIPEWVQEEMTKGRIKEKVNEETDEKYLIVLGGTKSYEVHVGDSIIKTVHGLSVKPKEVNQRTTEED